MGNIGPVKSAERIETLDLWRGFALLLVCLVNFRAMNSEYLTREVAVSLLTAGLDWRAESLVGIFFANKAHTIFSFLFGVGFALIAERATAMGGSASRYQVRRLVILLIFGWLHFVLLYEGEILRRYAVLGLLLLGLVRFLGLRALVVIGLIAALTGRLIYEERALFVNLSEIAPSADGAGGPVSDTIYARMLAADWPEYVSLNAHLAFERTADISRGFFLHVYYLGRIMLGYAFWASGCGRRALSLATTAVLRMTAGFAAVSVFLSILVRIWSPGEVGTLAHLGFNFVRHCSILATSATYLALLFAIHRLGWLRRIRHALVAVGRMSLSNYVAQTFGMILVFGGPGLALGAHLGVVGALVLGGLFFLAQAALSILWLRWRAQGPLEWCWRKLVYM